MPKINTTYHHRAAALHCKEAAAADGGGEGSRERVREGEGSVTAFECGPSESPSLSELRTLAPPSGRGWQS